MSTDDQFFVGLSLNSDFIRIVETDGSFITNIAERDLVQSFGIELFRTDSTGFTFVEDSVRSLLGASGVKAKKIGIVITKDMAHVKKVPVPLGLDQDMINQQINWEAEQFLVSPLTDYIIQYEKLPFQTREGNPLYLIICVRKQVISKLHMMSKNLGMKLVDVDVDVFSQIRVLSKIYELNTDAPFLLLEVCSKNLRLTILQKGEYFLSQILPYRDDLDNSDPDSSAVYGLIEKELKRLLFGHDIGQGIDDLGGIFFIGTENASDIASHIESVSEIPVVMVNPFKHIRIVSELNQSKYLTKYPDKFTAPVGEVVKMSPAIVEVAS